MTDPPTIPPGIRRALALAAGNALSFALVLALAAMVGEVWLRLQWPFAHSSASFRFVPRVGRMFVPDTEVRTTNRLDYFTVSRTNRQGFIDRGPIAPERAAASCHVALIGDSFVAAPEVPVAEKVHVRLEELAARALPALDVTTSAFGINNTGQINQLPLYDEFARRLRPRLLVLVFVINDFANNAHTLMGLGWGGDPDLRPWVSARRTPDGGMRLVPPPALIPAEVPLYRRSWFATWLESRVRRIDQSLSPLDETERLREQFEGSRRRGITPIFDERDLSPRLEAALDFTAFGFDQFQERADRDGVSLVVLSTHTMGTRGDPAFDRMNALAAARGIPVIDQSDHVRRRGAALRDARWANDLHWNAAGHRWAAEALLDHLKRNPEVRARRPAKKVPAAAGPAERHRTESGLDDRHADPVSNAALRAPE